MTNLLSGYESEDSSRFL